MAGILAAIFYGTNPLGTLPLYSENINSESVLFYRYGMAVVIFVLWMLLRGESFRIKWGKLSDLQSLALSLLCHQ